MQAFLDLHVFAYRAEHGLDRPAAPPPTVRIPGAKHDMPCEICAGIFGITLIDFSQRRGSIRGVSLSLFPREWILKALPARLPRTSQPPRAAGACTRRQSSARRQTCLRATRKEIFPSRRTAFSRCRRFRTNRRFLRVLRLPRKSCP